MDVLRFWDILCNTFGYRFFTGVPNVSLAPLFNTLDPEILHFVPAVTDSIAVDIAAGVSLCGDKSVVLCGPTTFDVAKVQIVNFIIKNKLPVLFITALATDFFGIKEFELAKNIEVIEQVDKYILKQQPAVLLYKDFL